MTERNLFPWCLALLGFVLIGCQTPNDFQKKWPEYPRWGWWNHPAPDAEEPASPEPAEESPGSSGEGEAAKPADEETPETPASESGATSSLEAHRAAVWEEVAVLRDLDDLPPEQQQKLVESARSRLRQWYRPMDVDPPNPDDPEWITVLVWDFMPEADFQRAAEQWRRTAAEEKWPYPEEITRRELMRFIRKVTRGELPPAATQPASAAEKRKEGNEK